MKRALARGAVEHAVGRQRTAGVDALGDQALHRRPDDGEIFFAQGTMLTGVRIEARHCEPRPRNVEALAHIALHNASRRDDQVGRELGEHVPERQMNRDRHHGQLRRPQQHHRLHGRSGRLGGESGQIFGVTRLGKAGTVEDVLGDRIGDHRGGATSTDVVDGAADRRQCGWCTGVVRLAGLGGDVDTDVDDWQRVVEGCPGGGWFHHRQRDVAANLAGAASQEIVIGKDIERRQVKLPPAPPR
jgi:hypothetical protein